MKAPSFFEAAPPRATNFTLATCHAHYTVHDEDLQQLLGSLGAITSANTLIERDTGCLQRL